MKKIFGLLMVMVMALSLAGCGSKDKKNDAATSNATESATPAEDAATEGANTDATVDADFKVGFIFIGDENEGYTAAHYNGAKEMQKALGLSDDQILVKWLVPEDETCLDAATDLVDQGCKIIFANSFGHEDFIIQAAQEYPDVQFCHATGYQAASCGLDNVHNYFTSVYESRYVSGVVAGLKLNEMIDNGTITADKAVIGYVGAYPYAEVISGYTSFYLGVKSVCESATMKVKYVNSWADFSLEQEAANSLIADGCVLISQHSDTTGAATACEAAKVPIVGYNISMIPTAANYALTSASINWGPYYTYAVSSVMNGTAIDTDWCKGYADGADCITELNTAAIAEGTEEKVAEIESAIKDGSLKVFDTSKFTVNGSKLEDLLSDSAYSKYAAYVSDGYFHESELASAPAFDIIIDGITAVE